MTNARHSCDNHFVLSHKSGRQFRGSDAGMLMLDKNLTNNAWVNIGSNMGNMMYYYVSVNEFGDQAMIGNTQDIDVQTWRYGRWGHWRGYEGSEASFNPYTNIGLFSGGGGSGAGGKVLQAGKSADGGGICAGISAALSGGTGEERTE